MKFYFTFLLILPFYLYSQTTVFSAKVDLFDLSSAHYELSHPLKPIIKNDTFQYFLGFSGGILNKYTKNINGVYENKELSLSSQAAVLAYEDFDKDGHLELLTSRDIFKYSDGTFEEKFFQDWQFQPRAHGDFNGDGLIDIIGSAPITFGPDKLYFMKNLGDFKFEEIVLEEGQTDYETFAVGDIDNDGNLDFIVTTRKEDYPIRIYFNDGNGNFTMKEMEFTKGTCSTVNAELFDFDNDGDLEILLVDKYNGIYIFENTDNFDTFISKDDFTLSRNSNPLIAKAYDFNKDNFTDLVVVTQSQTNLFVHYYEATGHYTYRFPRLLMTLPNTILNFTNDGTVITRNLNLVDLNNDGKMDITFTSGFDKKQVAVFNNTIISSNQDLVEEKFTISPNPVKDNLYLDIKEETNIQIFNQQGYIMKDINLLEQNLDVSNLNSGLYFLKATNKSGVVQMLKFIKID